MATNDTPELSQREQTPAVERWRNWLVGFACAVLACSVLGVFSRAWDYPFVDLDVPEQLINNKYVHGLTPDNIRSILGGEGPGSYYPVRALSYAFDYHFSLLEAKGYKRTNCFLHVANVLLVFALILRLAGCDGREESRGSFWSVFAALFGAGLFGVHPVVVEPVIWIPGREELLMTLGVLGTVHLYLQGRQLKPGLATFGQRVLWQIGATACCLLACLSNVVGAVVPLLLMAIEVTGRPRRPWQTALWATWPIWIVSLITVVVKILGDPDHNVVLAQPLSSEWLKIVLSTYGLNLKTLFWPSGLIVYYDWPVLVGLHDWKVILGGALAVLTAAGIWLCRRRPAIQLGLLWFLFALAPVSQIIPHHIVRADRFLYLPLAGLAIALAALLHFLQELDHSWGRARARAFRALLATLVATYLVVLGGTSRRQILTWRDSVTMWSHCLKVDPDNPYAHSCLADNLFEQGQYERAMAHYGRALELRPNHADTLGDCAWALSSCSDPRFRDFGLAVQMAERACDLTDWKAKRILRKLSVVRTNVGAAFAAENEFTHAIDNYRMAIDADPEFDVPLFNLALLLVTCPDEKLRSPEEAVRLAETGVRVTDEPDAHRLAILGAAYASAGRFEDAVQASSDSIQHAQREGNFEMIPELDRQRARYREGKPFDPIFE